MKAVIRLVFLLLITLTLLFLLISGSRSSSALPSSFRSYAPANWAAPFSGSYKDKAYAKPLTNHADKETAEIVKAMEQGSGHQQDRNQVRPFRAAEPVAFDAARPPPSTSTRLKPATLPDWASSFTGELAMSTALLKHTAVSPVASAAAKGNTTNGRPLPINLSMEERLSGFLTVTVPTRTPSPPLAMETAAPGLTNSS